MHAYSVHPETGLREEIPHTHKTINLTMPTQEPQTLSSPRPESKPLVRYMYTFRDSPKYPNGVPISGERITFEDSPITLFLHPNNQYWIKREDTPLMRALGKARQFCNERKWNSLSRKVSDLQTYAQETAKKSSPLLPNLHSGRISTFDIKVSMDRDGNYIQLDGKKGTPYEMLGLNHIPIQR